MTPQQARESFSAALDGELDDAAQRAFERVLAADPSLADEYRSFVVLCGTLRGAAGEDVGATPDLLPGIQRRLRARSRGRFYRDRFAERAGLRWQPVLGLAIALLIIVALAWLALGVFQGVSRS